MPKKLLSALLAASLALTLTACGEDKETSSNKELPSTIISEASASTTSSSTSAEPASSSASSTSSTSSTSSSTSSSSSSTSTTSSASTSEEISEETSSQSASSSTAETPPEPVFSYVLNKNTKKFHRPECGSVKDIKPKNYAEYKGTRDSVIAQGYVPCKICKP